jgi:hypothetical protein
VNLSIGRRYERVWAQLQRGSPTLDEIQGDGAPCFSVDQIETLNRAFRQACEKMGLTGSTPVIELVAVRILELAHAGVFDPDKLTETVLSEFDI